MDEDVGTGVDPSERAQHAGGGGSTCPPFGSRARCSIWQEYNVKAVVVSEFGAPSVLKLADMPKPQPDRDQVLVRVKAAGVGPWDAWIREGKSALPQPLPLIPGSDISGVVEGTGSAVSAFRPGDEIYGVTNKRFTGGYAEYALAEAGMIAPKPRTLDHVQAASVPVVAVTAWQMLFEYANLSAGSCAWCTGPPATWVPTRCNWPIKKA